MVPFEPDLGEIVELPVLSDVARRKVAVVIENRLRLRKLVIEAAGSARLEEKVFVDELHGMRRGSRWRRAWLGPVEKKRFQMPGIQILRDVPGHRILASLERVQIAVAHLGGDLVADVQQLSQVEIVTLVPLVVPHRRDKLRRAPAL